LLLSVQKDCIAEHNRAEAAEAAAKTARADALRDAADVIEKMAKRRITKTMHEMLILANRAILALIKEPRT
jgi:hypothetical protein